MGSVLNIIPAGFKKKKKKGPVQMEALGGYEYPKAAQKYVKTPNRTTQENRKPHWNYPKISKYRKPLGFV